MKLCQKCKDEIERFVHSHSEEGLCFDVDIAPEVEYHSECEFWAHKEADELGCWIKEELCW